MTKIRGSECIFLVAFSLATGAVAQSDTATPGAATAPASPPSAQAQAAADAQSISVQTYSACINQQLGQSFDKLPDDAKTAVLGNLDAFDPAKCNTPTQTAIGRVNPGTFRECMVKQLGVEFGDLSKETQAEILKQYDRFSASDCAAASSLAYTRPKPVNTPLYWLMLAVGLTAIVFIATKYSRSSFGLMLSEAVDRKKLPAVPGGAVEVDYKLSISRVIALIGLYVIVLTFAFSMDYAFWALVNRGDNNIFNQAVQNTLVPAFVAFIPYIANKIADLKK